MATAWATGAQLCVQPYDSNCIVMRMRVQPCHTAMPMVPINRYKWSFVKCSSNLLENILCL